MIIFGNRSSHIKSEILEYESCPNCGEQNKLLCSVYGNYFHIFWIPVFPTSKDVYVQCQNCGFQWDKYHMTPDMQAAASKFKKQQRSPIFHFAGLFLVAIFIAFIAFTAHDTNKKTASYLLDPQVGDIYRIRLNEDGYYSTMRIEEIEGDTVYFAMNAYSISKISKIDDIDKEENYDLEELVPLLKEELDLEEVEDFSLDQISRSINKK